MAKIHVTWDDWEQTVQRWINELYNYGDDARCGFCLAKIRTDLTCNECLAVSVCFSIDSLYSQWLKTAINSSDERQAVLAILEWLYGFGHKRGWC